MEPRRSWIKVRGPGNQFICLYLSCLVQKDDDSNLQLLYKCRTDLYDFRITSQAYRHKAEKHKLRYCRFRAAISTIINYRCCRLIEQGKKKKIRIYCTQYEIILAVRRLHLSCFCMLCLLVKFLLAFKLGLWMAWAIA